MPDFSEDPINFPDWIETIATMAGFKIQKLSRSLVVIKYKLPRERTQTVWINPIGKDPLGNTIIGISSPAIKMGAGQYLPQKKANDLLRQNAKLLHGAWVIENIEGDDYLAMFDTQIAQTIDTKEFAASVKAVAFLADEMERELDRDGF
ncbi:MAG: hypothetical protein GY850_36185, partial [bacterium]|nr:hypothetical protein [bacterium]